MTFTSQGLINNHTPSKLNWRYDISDGSLHILDGVLTGGNRRQSPNTAQRYLTNKVRNFDSVSSSLQDPLRKQLRSGSGSRSKYRQVRPRVYDHLSPENAKSKIKIQPEVPKFTPKILDK